MKSIPLLICVFWAFIFLTEASAADTQISRRDTDELYDKIFSGDYLSRKKFTCPSSFGTFPDPTDCSKYYICKSGVGSRKSCKKRFLFDKIRKTCLPAFIAVCGNDEDNKKTTTVSPKVSTPEGDNFVCSSFSGNYPHPEDCSKYYTCFFFQATLKSCPGTQLFDAVKNECKPAKSVNCGNRKKPETTTILPRISTPKEDNFECNSFSGNYPHPEDCSKYYMCFFFQATLKSCPGTQLFDDVKNECKPASSVNCGNRKIPGFSTTPVTETITESSSPPTSSTQSSTVTHEVTETKTTIKITDVPTNPPETTAKEIATTSRPTEPPKPTTTIKITDAPTNPPETTTKQITSTSRPTGPPETDCEEDDIDCIIDKTGDANDWFKCPPGIGSFPHPSSNKLFIFCKNRKASVKKCGMNLVFSKELSTCVEVK